MTDPAAVEQTIAGLLDEHLPVIGYKTRIIEGCDCGFEGNWQDWIEHVAAVLAVVVADADRALDQALAERDEAQEWADRLAYAIAPVEVIGEHTSANNPWQNAWDHAPKADEPIHDGNHAPLPEGVWLDPGYCADCDLARARSTTPQGDDCTVYVQYTNSDQWLVTCDRHEDVLLPLGYCFTDVHPTLDELREVHDSDAVPHAAQPPEGDGR